MARFLSIAEIAKLSLGDFPRPVRRGSRTVLILESAQARSNHMSAPACDRLPSGIIELPPYWRCGRALRS
jgi:hypothetical protein